MTAGEDNNLYTISVPDQFSCSNQNSNSKMNLAVITLPQTENSNASVSYTKPGVSSASYDWIGKVNNMDLRKTCDLYKLLCGNLHISFYG